MKQKPSLLCIYTCEREQWCSRSKVAEHQIIHIDLGCPHTRSFSRVLVYISIHGQHPGISGIMFSIEVSLIGVQV
jgi:hypothetical protein